MSTELTDYPLGLSRRRQRGRRGADLANACLALLALKIRLDVTQRAPSPAEFDVAVADSNRIQQQLWQQAMAMAAKNNDVVPTGLFIHSLNELIDDQKSG